MHSTSRGAEERVKQGIGLGVGLQRSDWEVELEGRIGGRTRGSDGSGSDGVGLGVGLGPSMFKRE